MQIFSEVTRDEKTLKLDIITDESGCDLISVISDGISVPVGVFRHFGVDICNVFLMRVVFSKPLFTIPVSNIYRMRECYYTELLGTNFGHYKLHSA